MAELQLIGMVEEIIYENNEELFKILDVHIIQKIAGYDHDSIRVMGNFGEMDMSIRYKFVGELIEHSKFGMQFKAKSYQAIMPAEYNAIVDYLASDKFAGIGKKTAEKIVSQLGEDLFTKIKDNNKVVEDLKLTDKQRQSLLNGILHMDELGEILTQAVQYGINKSIITDLYNKYKGETLSKIEEDPYALIAETRGYGFKIADSIANKLGFKADDSRRLKGALMQVLLDSALKDGNTYLLMDKWLENTGKLLYIDDFDLLANEVNNLKKDNKVVIFDDKVSLTNMYTIEKDIANDLKRISDSNKRDIPYLDDDLNSAIKHVEQKFDISYDDTQKKAIKTALNNSISILTGGPGTGKTTIIRGILATLQEIEKIPNDVLYTDDPPFLLAAPTGRAAKRMSELTGIDAKTIHRLLGLGISDLNQENMNELNGEILIVDEMSMVDMFLFKNLVSSIFQLKHIVFVGDKDQLPSVGPGNIFSDLIDSSAFPTTKLSMIHRQSDDSSIVDLAHKINQNNAQANIFTKTPNYSFISCNPNSIADAIEKIVDIALEKGFCADDIQVLTAMYNGVSGINSLNDLLQNIMNPAKIDSKKVEVHNEIFRIGDRVLQLQNNPEKEIYNGQIGKVVGIDDSQKSAKLIVRFDDREVMLTSNDLSDLTRAYAITIHKSQGSEFPLVILALTMQNYIMLKKNLLYTAITRAQQNLVMIGEEQAYQMALKTEGNDRQTDLCSKIQCIFNKNDIELQENETDNVDNHSENHILTPDLIYSNKIDPMIGMENVRLDDI